VVVVLHERSPSSWEREHARLVVTVRVGTGAWLLLLTLVAYRSGRGKRWALLLLPAAALHFYLAYRLRRPAPA
jgi:hypothetical protein